MEDNVKLFLDKIQELKEQKTKVYVMSSEKDIDCANLSFKQQKSLISTIGDGNIGAVKFQKIINDVIIENTGNANILVTDKLAIVMKMRMDSIGSTIKKDDVEIDLLPVLDKIKTISYTRAKNISGSVEVELSIPTLAEESKIIQSIIDVIKKDESEFGKTIGNIYTYEIVKYIKKVKMGPDELDLSIIPIKDRYKIVENLPLSINKEIISFIQKIKSSEVEALTYDSNKVLEIDVTFFDS